MFTFAHGQLRLLSCGGGGHIAMDKNLKREVAVTVH